jgi:hypothetical protein
VTKAAIREEYGWKRVTAKRAATVRGRLIGEVNTYDLFITGQVYGYEVTDDNDDCIDSCWGFITDDTNTLIEEGKDVIEYVIEEATK